MFGSSAAAMAQGPDSDSAADAGSARIDALLATPNWITPVPQDNAIATAPGLEQQTPTPHSRKTPSRRSSSTPTLSRQVPAARLWRKEVP